MTESGDNSELSFLGVQSERASILKLLRISEERQEFKTQPPDALCGWPTQTIEEYYANQQLNHENGKHKLASPKEDLLKRWKSAYFPQEDNPYKAVEDRDHKKRRKAKFHPKRLEELSLPRKHRPKPEVSNCSNRTLLPFDELNTERNADLRFHNKIAISKIALQYNNFDEKPEKVKNCRTSLFPNFYVRNDMSHSAGERNFEDSKREVTSSKTNSAASRKSQKGTKTRKPFTLAKTHGETQFFSDLETADDNSDDFMLETSSYGNLSPIMTSGLDLPLPQVKLTIKSSSDRRLETLLPAIKKKRPLGNVTAITQGNIKAGIKSNSIRKLGRQTIPHASVILPRLSGSRVEVPLLPQSPDFLHRIIH